MSSQENTPMTSSRLLKLAVPLMVSWLSTSIMLFADRFMLSKYSLVALGAAVHAGTFAWAFSFGFQIFTEMAQVIVAQFRGAEKYENMSKPSWQMIWLSLGSIALYIPLGIWGTKLFFTAGSLQATYFSILIYFGPFFGLIGACSSYFMGLGKNKVITYGAIIGNVVNLVLDYFMIFGVEGYLKPMGIKGAAIATGIGLVVQALFMLFYFLKKTGYEVKFFDRKLLKSCLRVCTPPAFFITAELLGWGVFYSLMGKTSSLHLLVTSVCNVFFPLIATVNIGFQKSLATESGRLIGSKRMDLIPSLLKVSLKLFTAYYLVLILAFAFMPSSVIGMIVSSKTESLTFNLVELKTLIRWGLMISSAYLYFGGIRFLIAGILSAAGDSRFLSIFGGGSIWVGLVLPIYFFIVIFSGSVTQAQLILMSYGILCAILYFYRYRMDSWKKEASLIDESTEKVTV